jgi:hypothetical protein
VLSSSRNTLSFWQASSLHIPPLSKRITYSCTQDRNRCSLIALYPEIFQCNMEKSWYEKYFFTPSWKMWIHDSNNPQVKWIHCTPSVLFTCQRLVHFWTSWRQVKRNGGSNKNIQYLMHSLSLCNGCTDWNRYPSLETWIFLGGSLVGSFT